MEAFFINKKVPHTFSTLLLCLASYTIYTLFAFIAIGICIFVQVYNITLGNLSVSLFINDTSHIVFLYTYTLQETMTIFNCYKYIKIKL